MNRSELDSAGVGMFGSSVIELGIGLILVFLLLSLLCSGINELVEGLLRRRAKFLVAGLDRLIGSDLRERLYGHPLVLAARDFAGRVDDPRGSERYRAPSHLPPQAFAAALIDELTKGAGETPEQSVVDRFRAAAGADPADPLAYFARTIGDTTLDAQQELAALKSRLEGWFEDAMAKVSAWYKRRTRWFLLLWAILVAFALNADTVFIARTLWRDEALRASVAAQADAVVADPDGAVACPDQEASENPFQCVADRLDEVEALNLPLGWPAWPWQWDRHRDDARLPVGGPALALKLVGLLVTALALTLGAPFWFDLLNRFVNFRSTGRAQPPPPRVTARMG